MCGIVGFITNETKKLERDRSKFMKHGLIIDTLRGDDSTGCFAVGHEPLYEDGTAFWTKRVGPGGEFVETQSYYESLLDTTSYRAVVGHNRAATVGAIDNDGAHPFQVGPITLVHNGTLRYTGGLPTPMKECKVPIEGKKKKKAAVTVDSHAIAYNLAHHSVEDVVAELRGAFALVWHDARDDSVNIIRNDERPLHMALSKTQDTLYFMSEGGMLSFLDERIGLDLSSIYYPKEGQWLKWLPDTPLNAPQVKTLELAIAYASYTKSPAWNGYGAWDDDDYAYNHGSSAMSGKGFPSRSEREDYVFVGGRTKAIPMMLQEALLKADLMVEDRLPFVPQSKLHNKHQMCIMGKLDGKFDAILYNQSEATGNLMDRAWSVRPVALLVRPTGTPLVVVKLVSTIFNATVTNSNCDTDDAGRRVLGYHDELDHLRSEEEKVRGPNGTRITKDEFRRRAADGCGICHTPLNVIDADEVMWTDDGKDILCGFCDEDSYYEMNGGHRIWH